MGTRQRPKRAIGLWGEGVKWQNRGRVGYREWVAEYLK